MQNEIIQDEIIQERIKMLPEIIQDAIKNSHWEEKIRIIGQKHNLVIGDSYILEKNTLLLMLGIIDQNAFEKNLSSELQIEKSTLISIIYEIEDQIFKNIKKYLIDFRDSEDAFEELATEAESKAKKTPDIDTAETGDTAIPGINFNRNDIKNELKDHLEIIDEVEDKIENDDVLAGFVTEKLQSPTETTVENVEINSSTLPEKLKNSSVELSKGVEVTPQKPEIDPYREQF